MTREKSRNKLNPRRTGNYRCEMLSMRTPQKKFPFPLITILNSSFFFNFHQQNLKNLCVRKWLGGSVPGINTCFFWILFFSFFSFPVIQMKKQFFIIVDYDCSWTSHFFETVHLSRVCQKLYTSWKCKKNVKFVFFSMEGNEDFKHSKQLFKLFHALEWRKSANSVFERFFEMVYTVDENISMKTLCCMLSRRLKWKVLVFNHGHVSETIFVNIFISLEMKKTSFFVIFFLWVWRPKIKFSQKFDMTGIQEILFSPKNNFLRFLVLNFPFQFCPNFDMTGIQEIHFDRKSLFLYFGHQTSHLHSVPNLTWLVLKIFNFHRKNIFQISGIKLSFSILSHISHDWYATNSTFAEKHFFQISGIKLSFSILSQIWHDWYSINSIFQENTFFVFRLSQQTYLHFLIRFLLIKPVMCKGFQKVHATWDTNRAFFVFLEENYVSCVQATTSAWQSWGLYVQR